MNILVRYSADIFYFPAAELFLDDALPLPPPTPFLCWATDARGPTRLEAAAYKYAIHEREDGGVAADPDVTNDASAGEAKSTRGVVETWLEDAFVGHLREDALLFVWDHLFLLG